VRESQNGRVEIIIHRQPVALPAEMTPYLFEICTSTHYGHMVMVDDETVVLSEAPQYIEY
jgi:propane monooxygenase coupling protein